jgi:nuclear transport factor 2 (NTF2) superfamily protein
LLDTGHRRCEGLVREAGPAWIASAEGSATRRRSREAVIHDPRAAEVVHAHVAAFNSADASRVASGFHVDARFCTGRDVVVEGRPSLRTFFEAAFRALSLELTVEVLVVDGHRVAVQMREHIVDDGVESVEHIAAFYEVDGGLLRSVKVYREGTATR